MQYSGTKGSHGPLAKAMGKKRPNSASKDAMFRKAWLARFN